MIKYYLLIFVSLCFACKKQDTHNQWNLNTSDFNELIKLCDTSTLIDYAQFGKRLDRIQYIFANANDRRGAFPTVYRAITNAAIVSINNGDYKDSLFIYAFAMDFSKRYLYILKDHLLGSPIEYHWELYYKHCKLNHSITRLVLEGINAHLTIDLTRSLAQVGVKNLHQDDWILFGDKTVIAVPGFLEELKLEYKTDASGIFNVFFFGDLIDIFLGNGFTINLGFNLLRMEAFNFAIPLQDADKKFYIEQKMKNSFYTKEDIFVFLDNLKLTP